MGAELDGGAEEVTGKTMLLNAAEKLGPYEIVRHCVAAVSTEGAVCCAQRIVGVATRTERRRRLNMNAVSHIPRPESRLGISAGIAAVTSPNQCSTNATMDRIESFFAPAIPFAEAHQ
jgi:hypothetical protein